MEDIELVVPSSIVDSLPEDGADAGRDMERAVAGWQARLNAVVSDDDAMNEVVDLVERFEDRWEAYDGYVVELRAWGQSPIYAMAWRNLYAAIIQQLYDNDELADHIDRERNARIVEDGIGRR